MTTTFIQRPTRGSRISSFYPVKSLPPLSSLESAFQLQEYISLLIRLDVHDVETIVSIPDKGPADEKEKSAEEDKGKEKEGEGEKKDVTVDEACWIYEQLRRLAQDLSHPLITMLQQECTRSSCPEMKAGEWLYLCVAHGNDGAMEQCCAIDYILHTLDSATALLNSPRAFPSRLSIPPSSHRHFSSLARRLGRIFAHAYFHHREAFEQAEAESSLYARFLALTSKFELVPAEFLVIPPRVVNHDNDRNDNSQITTEPRLRAAAVNVSLPVEEETEEDESVWDRSAPTGTTNPPGLVANTIAPPRKNGRTRTDTMVHSEAFSIAEELAKVEAESVEIVEEPISTDEAPEADIMNEPILMAPGDPILNIKEEPKREPSPPPSSPPPPPPAEIHETPDNAKESAEPASVETQDAITQDEPKEGTEPEPEPEPELEPIVESNVAAPEEPAPVEEPEVKDTVAIPSEAEVADPPKVEEVKESDEEPKSEVATVEDSPQEEKTPATSAAEESTEIESSTETTPSEKP